MSNINRETQDLAKNWLPSVKSVSELSDAVNEFRRDQLAKIIVNINNNNELVVEYNQKTDNDSARVQRRMDRYAKLISEPEERVAFEDFKIAWQKYMVINQRIEVLLLQNKPQEAGTLLFGDARVIYNTALSNLLKAISINDQGSSQSAAKASDEYSRSRLITLILTVVSTLIAIMFSVLLIRVVLKQLGEDPGYLYEVSMEIANGNLDVKLKSFVGEGGVYGALTKMVATLKAKIKEAEEKSAQAAQEAQFAKEATAVAEEATQKAQRARAEGMMQAAKQLEEVVTILTTASEELSAQVEQSRRGADDQSGRVRETATAMEEMNATILEVAGNAQHAAEASTQTRQQAIEGTTIVADVVKSIESVRVQSAGIKSDMDMLGKQALAIGQILNVIADIADQTNLLALNAAIEAARAGDAGRGFAVVADEVRKLAEKSMTATQEVGKAINDIQEGTKKNIAGVESNTVAIEQVALLSTQSGEALTKILEFVNHVNDQVQSIATASEEQSAASEEINRSVEEVATISNETSVAMEHASGSVAKLLQQVQVLQKLITELKSAK
jgi:Methyl-accepting chemotaxis protein